MNDLLVNYQKLNSSFRKKLVFRIGMEAGFFSEYNNMVLAMLYCLINRIQFVLYSDNANFGFDKGWTDYFLPFCEEATADFHKRYNHRYPGYHFSRTNRLKMWFYKKLYKFDYFTHELWYAIREEGYFESRQYHIPELGVDGSLHDACMTLVKMTWRYNNQTKSLIDNLSYPLNLTDSYLSFHIRQGDKSTEQELIAPDVYIQKAKSLSDIETAFILTDDYDIIDYIQTKYPTWSIYTLCEKSEHGYYHSNFQQMGKDAIKNAHIKLFASIEICSRSTLFIGTFSSNPGMYLGMRMPLDRCYGLDSEKWQIW